MKKPDQNGANDDGDEFSFGSIPEPRAPALHLVLVPEEDLGILGIREALEPRPGAEVARRNAPSVLDDLSAAESDRPDTAALAAETIDLTVYQGLSTRAGGEIVSTEGN